MKVPINRQRIIFQGKLLNNTEILSQLKVNLLNNYIYSFGLKVENGHVLHLIALPNNIPVIDNDHSQQNPTNPNINSNSNPIPNQEIEFLNGVFRTISFFLNIFLFFNFLTKIKMKAQHKEEA